MFMRAFARSHATVPRFELRDYQRAAVDSVLGAVQAGVRRPAVVLATGGGKTVVMASLIPQLRLPDAQRTRTLVLAHKEELVRQTARTLRVMHPGLGVDIDMLRQRSGPALDVVVASVSTLARAARLGAYDAAHFKAIVIDECHHAPARLWTQILRHFGALEPALPVVVVGFTATMERADGRSLGDVFERVVYLRGLPEMVRSKELCDARFWTVNTDADLAAVATRAGDYEQQALERAVVRLDVNAQVARAYLQLRRELGFRSTLVFCVSVDHCTTLCGALQAHGVNAQYVTGNTAKHVRQQILDDFRAGTIAVLCNVLVFTEGTDIPGIDSLVIARPTKLRPLLTQMLGRGLRLAPGKDVCHVLDMASSLRVGVLSVPTLFGLPDSHSVNAKSFAQLEQERLALDAQQLAQVEQEAARARELAVRHVIDYQLRVAAEQLRFDSIAGFAGLVQGGKDHASEHPQHIQTAFRKSGHHWVRLEYAVWGLPIARTDAYFTITSLDTNTGAEFELCKVTPASRQALIASNFKCARRHSQIVNRGALPFLLAVASRAVGHHPFKAALKKPASQKQVDYLFKNLRRKVRSLYGPDRDSDLLEALGVLEIPRASNLIFALKYSVNSLWTLWELRQMLGIPPKVQASMDRKISKLRTSTPMEVVAGLKKFAAETPKAALEASGGGTIYATKSATVEICG